MNEPDLKNNIAFVDGQNLYMGTTKSETPWNIDLARFRIYLAKKYNVQKAYYFLGYVQDGNDELYDYIQSSGFILRFRQHSEAMISKKKGNVDSDIIFEAMKKIYKEKDLDKIVLVSGDGDYKMLVDFLIEEGRFEKILFPNRRRASSLYKGIGNRYSVGLNDEDVKKKIQKEKGALGS